MERTAVEAEEPVYTIGDDVKTISWEEMFKQTDKQLSVLFDELQLIRLHVIALYEVLTAQQFATTEVTTVDLLQFLTTKGRELLDSARDRMEAATHAEMTRSREVYHLKKKTDVVIGLLAQALVTCTSKSAPTSSASSQSPAAGSCP